MAHKKVTFGYARLRKDFSALILWVTGLRKNLLRNRFRNRIKGTWQLIKIGVGYEVTEKQHQKKKTDLGRTYTACPA